MSIVKVSTLVVLTALSSAAFAKPQFTAQDTRLLVSCVWSRLLAPNNK